MPASQTVVSGWTEVNDFDLADPEFFKPAPIDMLLGSDILPLIINSGLQKNLRGNLLAQETEFGWIISGNPTTRNVTSFATWITPSDPLSDQLRQFWELENIPSEEKLSETDIWCEKFYQNTVERWPDGKYVVRLPFNHNLPENVNLGASRRAAMGQFLHMEKTLQKSPVLASEYKNVLSEYYSLGHMEPTTSKEIFENGHCSSFYLPHHAVIKPERTTTKVRVVFTASKKTDNSIQVPTDDESSSEEDEKDDIGASEYIVMETDGELDGLDMDNVINTQENASITN
ncbi:uncharacterized protein [Musca autumnalis]|uniref:uncharacterized protein n=1 Tax=Musca autumnalis TaxID=221902 RepID=UPI003CF6A472